MLVVVTDFGYLSGWAQFMMQLVDLHAALATLPPQVQNAMQSYFDFHPRNLAPVAVHYATQVVDDLRSHWCLTEDWDNRYLRGVVDARPMNFQFWIQGQWILTCQTSVVFGTSQAPGDSPTAEFALDRVHYEWIGTARKSGNEQILSLIPLS